MVDRVILPHRALPNKHEWGSWLDAGGLRHESKRDAAGTMTT
jgi:hypothetical protein